MQLNKIRQTEWEGLEKYLTVFFTAEFEPEQDSLKLILEQQQLLKDQVLLIGNSTFSENIAADSAVDYLNVKELFIV